MKIAKECDEDDLEDEEGEEVEMLSDENKNINRSHLTRQMDLILYACCLLLADHQEKVRGSVCLDYNSQRPRNEETAQVAE